MSLLAGLSRGYQGVSSALARELAAAAGVSEAASPSSLAEAEWEALWQAWRSWLARLESGTFAAARDAATGRVSVLGAFGERVDSVHALVDSIYR